MDRKTKIILLADVVLLIVSLIVVVSSFAEKTEIEAWVMCQPGSFVNVRKGPSSRYACIGRYETGDKVLLDGKFENRYAYSSSLALEDTEGWISTGYLVFDEPVWKDGEWYTVNSNGRVAMRRCIEGERTSWVKDGTQLQVFWWSEEWCCTTRGVIRTEFLIANEEVSTDE